MKNLFDIVIPVGPNDVPGVAEQITCTKKNVQGYRNIYLICSDPSTSIEGCATIHENIFPFDMRTVENFHGKSERNGWYLQQLLKLYAGEVIPGILDRYLVIDSDTHFLKPTTFVQQNMCMYNYSRENHKPYFSHMKKLHPELTKQKPGKSGICHHMMFESRHVSELFRMVQDRHGEEFYNVFLRHVDTSDQSGASEYEIYFNYMLRFHREDIILRKLEFINGWTPNDTIAYISKHKWIKNKS